MLSHLFHPTTWVDVVALLLWLGFGSFVVIVIGVLLFFIVIGRWS